MLGARFSRWLHTLKRYATSLTGQLFTAFVCLVVASGWFVGVRVYTQVDTGTMKARQLLHWDTASALAKEIEPLVRRGDIADIYPAILSFQEKQPGVDVYLLDEHGRVEMRFSKSGGTPIIPLETIDIVPIKRFITEGEMSLPILGMDPAAQTKKVLFSAATLQSAGETFYVYLVLGNVAERSLRQGILDRALVMGVPAVVAVTAFVAAMAGLFVFSLIIKPFTSALQMIFRFQAGDYSGRLPFRKQNEVGRLSSALNSLGEAVSSQIEELDRRERLRRELVANVAHDLRGPLFLIRHGIEHFPSVTQKEGAHDDAVQSLVSGIDRNSTMLERLLSELFELSRLEANEQAPELAAVEADELCRDLAARFDQRAKNAGVSIHVDFEPDLPCVVCDAILIERALSNLLENAIRYVEPGGSITLRGTRDGDAAVLSVSDSGCGIPASALAQVFDRNFQVRGREKGFAGLGLAIVQRIIESHGSRVEVESEVNRGTTFSFRLRLEREEALRAA